MRRQATLLAGTAWDRARLEACFVPFVLFVVEPFPLRSHAESGRGSGALTTLFP